MEIAEPLAQQCSVVLILVQLVLNQIDFLALRARQQLLLQLFMPKTCP